MKLLIFVFGAVNLHLADPSPPAVPRSLPLLLSLAQGTSRDFKGRIKMPSMFSISYCFWDLAITDWGSGVGKGMAGKRA